VAMQNPTVSIGMPVYNGARFLKEALDAILGQTFTNFELIISDNCSTDSTSDICQEYASRDRRIRYYRNTVNLGASRNFNRVVELAAGRYFRWAPADDVFAPDSLEACVMTLEANPDLVLCYPKTMLIDDHSQPIEEYEDGLDLQISRTPERFQAAMAHVGLINVIYGLIRTKALRKTALIENFPGSDTVLVLELSLHGQFMEIPRRLFFRRMHEKASSSIKSVEGLQEFFDPRTKGKIFLRGWRHHFAYWQAALRAPVSLVDRIHLCLVLARHAMWARRKLVNELWTAFRQLSPFCLACITQHTR
jgi:glycosyltransferase involved in cell wall biosynthesis